MREYRGPILFAIGLALFIGIVGALPTVGQGKPYVYPVGRRYPASVERWRPLVKRYFPHTDHGKVPRRLQQEALAIILWESGGNPNDGPCEGIWQFSRDHGTHAQRMSPVISTRMAARLWLLQGKRWRPAWAAARRLRLR
jgi:hypothetical protein